MSVKVNPQNKKANNVKKFQNSVRFLSLVLNWIYNAMYKQSPYIKLKPPP